MADRRKIEEKIARKQAEIQELEEKVKDARVYIQALQDVLKLFPRDTTEVTLRPGSMVEQARALLLKNGRPMHLKDIVEGLGREVTRENQTALYSSLAGYVRKREIFTRPEPNTFGLIEFAEAGDTSLPTEPAEPPEAPEPPADFGKEPEPADEFDDDIPF